ncbi:AMP-binding protein, partial [Paracoccaceae bacterium]|nr:AMP-binding protein [Paracoccaceae bacterium]
MTENCTIGFKENIETHYDGRELMCFANRPNDFLEIFKDVVTKYPTRIALCFNEKIITYKQLDELSDNFAGGLLESGLKEKNILVINLANSIEFVVALFASFKTGLIAMPVGHRHKKEELISLYNDAGVHAVIFDKETA